MKDWCRIVPDVNGHDVLIYKSAQDPTEINIRIQGGDGGLERFNANQTTTQTLFNSDLNTLLKYEGETITFKQYLEIVVNAIVAKQIEHGVN